MAADAPYVNRGPQGADSRFEGYKPLIVMFFLGASDKNTAPCDGYTFEARLEQFIAELAHIGRAHNWDKERIKLDARGKPVLDEHGQNVMEEYDDLEGDKPSCYSGVKRRLFQSVQGHPLFKLLTMDDIKQELREVVREHFKQCIQTNPEAAIEWKEAWDEVCDAGLGGEVLSAMDIPEAAQTTFIEELGKKYPVQFDGDPRFKTYIQDRFKLNKQITTHAARFGGETDLTALLEPCVARKKLSREELAEKRLKSSSYVMFKPTQSVSSSEEEGKEQKLTESKQPDSRCVANG